jgi:alkanesulfonate monooxygenase SsuD/methylene tetrahydromethanopterin reductase-like flavin-dependent oxidoreductase (luciferase family)
MEFGVQFFPDVSPEDKSPVQYFSECLDIAERADALGFTHIRTVEHYFHYYGGYSPNPLVFLAAAAQRTLRAKMITGAILPVFNHPLKLAGEIGMVDALSGGRLEVGIARAFLPHEFRRFGVSPDESVARFREGLEQIELLLTQENVTHEGRFHQIRHTTSLPRPTQKPRPKFYIAAVGTPESFAFAGERGHSIMAIPMGGGKIRELLQVYRDAWQRAGHPGKGEAMLAFHMFCHPDGARAKEIARGPINGYLHSLADAAGDWVGGEPSKDYPNYDKLIAGLKRQTMDTLMESGAAWVGTPEEIREAIARAADEFGGFEHASMQVNFSSLPFDEALRSMDLFAAEVMPHFAAGAETLRARDAAAA